MSYFLFYHPELHTSQNHNKHFYAQSGSITLVIIAVFGLLSAFILTISSLNTSPVIIKNLSLSVLLACISITISIVALITVATRFILSQKYCKEIRSKLPDIERLISNTHQMLNYYDRMMLDYSHSLGRHDIKYLVAIQKIIGALEDRYVELVRLASSSTTADIKTAYSLLYAPLLVQQNSIQTIIDSAPIPPIKAESIAPTLEALFEDFEAASSLFQFGIKKLA